MTEERLEKVRKLREMKKFGKKVQIEVQQKREKEKRDMLEEVAKINLQFSLFRNQKPLTSTNAYVPITQTKEVF